MLSLTANELDKKKAVSTIDVDKFCETYTKAAEFGNKR